jgi:hypothetical protein
VLISILKMNVMRKCHLSETFDLLVDLTRSDRAMIEPANFQPSVSNRSTLGSTVREPSDLEGGAR